MRLLLLPTGDGELRTLTDGRCDAACGPSRSVSAPNVNPARSSPARRRLADPAVQEAQGDRCSSPVREPAAVVRDLVGNRDRPDDGRRGAVDRPDEVDRQRRHRTR
jgi:hypothetical protein